MTAAPPVMRQRASSAPGARLIDRGDAANLLAFGLVETYQVDLAPGRCWQAAGGRRIEDGVHAATMRVLDGGGGRIEVAFALRQEDAAHAGVAAFKERVDGSACLCRRKGGVGSSRQHDAIVPVASKDDGDSGRGVLTALDACAADAVALEPGDKGIAEDVGTDSAHHMHHGAHARRRDRLVGAFAAGSRDEVMAMEGLARAWHAFTGYGEVLVYAAKHDDGAPVAQHLFVLLVHRGLLGWSFDFHGTQPARHRRSTRC